MGGSESISGNVSGVNKNEIMENLKTSTHGHILVSMHARVQKRLGTLLRLSAASMAASAASSLYLFQLGENDGAIERKVYMLMLTLIVIVGV